MDGSPGWQADFFDAHERHWGDGEILFNAQRWANADHLYGLSAECGMKAVMVGLGMPTDKQGIPDGQGKQGARRQALEQIPRLRAGTAASAIRRAVASHEPV